MDQIICYECLGNVSNLAESCPHCGASAPDSGATRAAYQSRLRTNQFSQAVDWAISAGGTKALEAFVGKIVAREATTVDWSELLFWAAGAGSVKLGKTCLRMGADVNFREKGGGTPLIESAGHGHSEFVEMLLENDADIDLEDISGANALFKAAKIGRAHV